jgi:RNA polymerase sigma factor (sigma-70 family)
MSEFPENYTPYVEQSAVEDAPQIDTERAARIRNGDDLAFAELWQQHEPYGRALATKKGASYQDAEDAAQEAGSNVWRYMQKHEMVFTGQRGARSYIGCAIVNASIDARRKANASTRPKEDLTSDFEYIPVPSAPSAEDDALSIQARHELAAAIKCLPPEYASVICAVYYDEESMTSYARRNGISVTTVKTRLKNARSYLKKQLLA